MVVIDGKTWLEIPSERECWELLATHTVGRLAVVEHDKPLIFPLNYVCDGMSIVFRTEAGQKLRAIRDNVDVAFEVDDIDRTDHTGWSVIVNGSAERVRDAADLRRLSELDLEPWAMGAKPTYVRVSPAQVSGRRIQRRVGSTVRKAGDDLTR